MELERQMCALDRQVDEFRRQVSAIAGQEARLKARIAKLSIAGASHADHAPDDQISPAACGRFVLANPQTGDGTAVRSAPGQGRIG